MQQKIREYALNHGASLVGFANADAMADAPEGYRPTDIMPAARGLVVLAKALPKGVVASNNSVVYTANHNHVLKHMDELAHEVALLIEELGAVAMPIPADDPYYFWDNDRKHGMAILSHRHAAVKAGLGTLGKSALLLTPKYGNRVELVTILTDVEFTTPLPLASLCPTECRLCVDACPSGAQAGSYAVEQKPCRYHVAAKSDRGHSLYRCWQCRAVCPAGEKR